MFLNTHTKSVTRLITLGFRAVTSIRLRSTDPPSKPPRKTLADKGPDPFQPPTRPMGPKPKKEELEKKLREKTPIGKLDELPEGQHPHQEKDPLPAFPNNTNPQTGEIGGPRGPEPTRYGDWERKGRVSDF